MSAQGSDGIPVLGASDMWSDRGGHVSCRVRDQQVAGAQEGAWGQGWKTTRESIACKACRPGASRVTGDVLEHSSSAHWKALVGPQPRTSMDAPGGSSGGEGRKTFAWLEASSHYVSIYGFKQGIRMQSLTNGKRSKWLFFKSVSSLLALEQGWCDRQPGAPGAPVAVVWWQCQRWHNRWKSPRAGR